MASNFFTTTCSLDIGILLLRNFSWTQCQPPNGKKKQSRLHPCWCNLYVPVDFAWTSFSRLSLAQARRTSTSQRARNTSFRIQCADGPMQCPGIATLTTPHPHLLFSRGIKERVTVGSNPSGTWDQMESRHVSKVNKSTTCHFPSLRKERRRAVLQHFLSQPEFDPVTWNMLEHGEDVKTFIGLASPQSLGSEAVRDLGANLSHAKDKSLAAAST